MLIDDTVGNCFKFFEPRSDWKHQEKLFLKCDWEYTAGDDVFFKRIHCLINGFPRKCLLKNSNCLGLNKDIDI